jgi:hypothetical protein
MVNPFERGPERDRKMCTNCGGLGTVKDEKGNVKKCDKCNGKGFIQR